MHWYKKALVEKPKVKFKPEKHYANMYDWSEYPLDDEFWLVSENDKQWIVIKAWRDTYQSDWYYNMPMEKKDKYSWEIEYV